nr:hypothetical protein BSM_08700 [uncultured archaeon]
MREIFTSCSVRGLIATLGLLPQKRCAMGSTRHLIFFLCWTRWAIFNGINLFTAFFGKAFCLQKGLC